MKGVANQEQRDMMRLRQQRKEVISIALMKKVNALLLYLYVCNFYFYYDVVYHYYYPCFYNLVHLPFFYVYTSLTFTYTTTMSSSFTFTIIDIQ